MEDFEQRLIEKRAQLFAGSMRVTDEKGNLLVAYFAHGYKDQQLSAVGGKKKRRLVAASANKVIKVRFMSVFRSTAHQ